MALANLQRTLRAAGLGVSAFALMANGPVPLANGQAVDVADAPFAVQASEGTRGVELTSDGNVRFRVEPGHVWTGDRRAGKSNERAEISSRLRGQYGDTMSAQFAIRLADDPGMRKGRDWMVLAQIHGPNRDTLPAGRSFASPIFALELRGDELVFVSRGGSEDEGETGARIIGAIPARFGDWQSFSVIAELGEQARLGIATEAGTFFGDGPLGYDAGDRTHYWKFGIYRSGGMQASQIMDLRLYCVAADGPCGGAQ